VDSLGIGEWQVEGVMTHSMATRQCKPNPGDGVSSIPLATLSGSAAPAGGSEVSFCQKVR
jgi:hypothetical protein